MSPTIRIDEEVFETLQRHGKPFVDSPNDVLRRLLSLNGATAGVQILDSSTVVGHQEAVIDDPVMLIRIAKRYRSGMSDDELYHATRTAWKVGKRRENARFACAVFEGVVREVFEIHRWRHITDRNRWEFDGVTAEEPVRSKYVGRRVDAYLPHGAQNPIRYVNC